MLSKAVYFSQLAGKAVSDSKGRAVGTLKDLVMVDGELTAPIVALVVKSNGSRKKIPWKFVESVERQVFLEAEKGGVEFEDVADTDLLVNEVVMDRQIIDVNGVKILKVNDVLLSKSGDRLEITSVDVGAAGFLRRLGIKAFPRLFGGKLIGDFLIPWKHVAPLELSSVSNIKVNVEGTKLNEVHPADLADLLEEMSHSERAIVFKAIKDEQAADTLAEAAPDVAKSLFKSLTQARIAQILKKMEPDEAVDVLSLFPHETVLKILKSMTPEEAAKLLGLLSFPDEAAGSLMNPNVLSLDKDLTAKKAISVLRTKMRGLDRAYYIYVVDKNNKLCGITSLRRLIIAEPDRKLGEFMGKRAYRVKTSTPVENITKIINKYDLLSLPVVDDQNRLVGVIAIDDVFEEIVPASLKKRRYTHVHVG